MIVNCLHILSFVTSSLICCSTGTDVSNYLKGTCFTSNHTNLKSNYLCSTFDIYQCFRILSIIQISE